MKKAIVEVSKKALESTKRVSDKINRSIFKDFEKRVGPGGPSDNRQTEITHTQQQSTSDRTPYNLINDAYRKTGVVLSEMSERASSSSRSDTNNQAKPDEIRSSLQRYSERLNPYQVQSADPMRCLPGSRLLNAAGKDAHVKFENIASRIIELAYKKKDAYRSDISELENHLKEITQGYKGKEIVSTFDRVRTSGERDKTFKIGEFRERYRLAVVSAEQMLNQAGLVYIQHPEVVGQFKHYFSLHYERVAQGLQATRDHFDSGNFHDLDENNLKTLDHPVTELQKALKRIDFRVKYPTAQDVFLSHTLPQDSMDYFQRFQDAHWRKIAEKRAKKERVAFTEEYYLQYKADLAEKSRLSDGQPLWVCRELATFEAGLDEGCVLSSMEAETTGTKRLRSQDVDPKAIFMEAAKKLFGYTSEELSPEVYFTYMTIGKPDWDKGWGDVGIRAKPEAGQRATKMFYPTSVSTTGPKPYSLYTRPIPLDQAGIDCFPLKGVLWYGDADLNIDLTYMALHNTRDPLDFQSIDDIKPWAEAQIHGGMTVDDIEEVTFSQPIHDKDRRDKIKGLLDKYDIKHDL